MNYALIIAGGSGNRMGQDIPKQFINVYDKPVLIYTLESFQKHPLINAIEVVCISGWESMVQAYANQFNITKLKWIVPGGGSAQESIHNGVLNLEGICSKDDIIIIHDGIRPLVDDTVLTDVIEKAQEYGNAVTSMPYNEQMTKAQRRSLFRARHCVVSQHHRHTTSNFLTRNTTRPLKRTLV